ncbi:MAG: methyl-accepting chemotaxis protein [Rubrivivax sp.]
MRINLPVTGKEYDFDGGTTLMSKTDPKGRIQYANAAFIDVSGFTREELFGKAHNIVRHPDMPPAAYADLWQTLKDGHSWTALVKNRRKDGDHYWVRANVTPVVRNGQHVAYISVRTRPSAQDTAAAEALYRRMREGQARSITLRRGVAVYKGLWAWRSFFTTASVATRTWLGCGLAALPAAATALALSPSLPTAAALGGAALAGWLAGGWLLQRQIVAPLRRVARKAQEVASGDTSQQFELGRLDDIGMLLRSVNQAGLNLRSLLDDVSSQVGGLSSASGEIAAGSDHLSSRTEQAAASLEQTAASMEQMTGSVRQSADSARAASEIAGGACTAAAEGGRVVGGFVATMDEISRSSQRIADITSQIDAIAFQTNLLALNAAVEAARAGEQGRGFAVVAGEVRALAQRAAGAAREIKGLVGASAQSVQAGSQQVASAGAAMERIVQQVRRVGELIAEISHAATEQSQGLGQVNAAVGELDRVTQQNAALVEQSAAAAGCLRAQATVLSDAVQAFREAR